MFILFARSTYLVKYICFIFWMKREKNKGKKAIRWQQFIDISLRVFFFCRMKCLIKYFIANSLNNFECNEYTWCSMAIVLFIIFKLYLCRVYTEQTHYPCDDFIFLHSIIWFLYSMIFCGFLADSFTFCYSKLGWSTSNNIRNVNTMNSISYCSE